MSKQGKPISREEMIKRHHSRQLEDPNNTLNEFSRRALRGLQYLPEGQSLEESLYRIDTRLRKKSGPARSISLLRRLSMGAAAAVLLFAVYFVFFLPPDKEALFAQHFDYLPGAFQARTGNELATAPETTASLRERAIKAYEAENYEAALPLAENYMKQVPGDIELGFYYGILLLGEGKTEAAIPYLEAVVSQPPTYAYERPGRWYLGLAFFKAGRKARAEQAFRALAQGKDRYATNARALLREWLKQ